MLLTPEQIASILFDVYTPPPIKAPHKTSRKFCDVQKKFNKRAANKRLSVEDAQKILMQHGLSRTEVKNVCSILEETVFNVFEGETKRICALTGEDQKRLDALKKPKFNTSRYLGIDIVPEYLPDDALIEKIRTAFLDTLKRTPITQAPIRSFKSLTA
jgi:hypothetical protein